MNRAALLFANLADSRISLALAHKAVRMRPAARAHAIEDKAEGIGTSEHDRGLDGISELAPDGDDGKDREKHEKQSDEKTQALGCLAAKTEAIHFDWKR